MRKNPDDDLRKLERLAKQGDPDALAALQRHRLRNQTVDIERELVNKYTGKPHDQDDSGHEVYRLFHQNAVIGYVSGYGRANEMHDDGGETWWAEVFLPTFSTGGPPTTNKHLHYMPGQRGDFPTREAAIEAVTQAYFKHLAQHTDSVEELRRYYEDIQKKKNPMAKKKTKARKKPASRRKSRAKNPPDGLKLAKARQWLAEAISAYADGSDKQYLSKLIAATRPADRDKLEAEARHIWAKMRQERGRRSGSDRLQKQANPGLAIIHAGAIVNPPKRGRKKAGKTKALPKRKNFNRTGMKGLGRQSGGEVGDIPLEEFIENNKHNAKIMAALEKDIKAYKRFHGSEPKSVKVFEYDNGGTEEIKTGIILGQAPETHYVLPNGQESNKVGSHWVHHHKKGKLPYIVMDTNTGLYQTVGGAFRTTTWMYD